MNLKDVPLEIVLKNQSINMEDTSMNLDNSQFAPLILTLLSSLSTLAAFYLVWNQEKKATLRSTILPGYGILGDTVNEVVEVFLDTLAIYVHNDKQWDCSRRMLCEANQRAAEYGFGYGILTYLLSLSVSFVLRHQRVSESMEAMRRGRHGIDCKTSYPHCPFSL